MRSYALPVSIRKLLAILVAFAAILAPTLTRAGEAHAAAFNHHMQMMDTGHCKAPPSDTGDHEKAAGKDCCISMCTGLAVALGAPFAEKAPRRAPAVFGISTLHLAYLGEIATPPPKHS